MSQNFKTLVSSVTLILLGIVADHFLVSKFKAEKPPAKTEIKECDTSSSEDLRSLRGRLTGISEKEIHDYLAVNSAEEKLRKADEILAKVIQIFIADVGYKISSHELNQLGKTPTSTPASLPIDTQPPPAQKLNQPQKPHPIDTIADRKPRLQISIIRDEKQVQEFLKVVAQNDFVTNLKASGSLTQAMARQINGRFTGFVNFFKSAKQLKAEMTFEGEVQNGKLSGSHDIRLSDVSTGKSTSHSRGRGILDKTYTTYDGAYIIEIGGDYLELYYFPALEQLSGYFLEIQKGEYKRIGTVVMQKL